MAVDISAIYQSTLEHFNQARNKYSEHDSNV